MKNITIGILVFILPSFLAVLFLKLTGAKIGKNVKIGFSYLGTSKLVIGSDVSIGHGNLIVNEKLILSNYARIGYLNVLKGPFVLMLKEKAAIGNKNYITRGSKGVTYGESFLKLGELTKITSGHHIDLTKSVVIGSFSILAGIRSQIWTHGYYHGEQGPERIRIDGEVHIGDNVYVGSGCIFNPGVKVSNAIHIGAGSVISKSLEKPGMYVNQTLRYLDNDLKRVKSKLKEVEENNLIEKVYLK
ncbi:acyltransferase [Aestuariivivens sediminicola]|uniref:acyltransferase n=1 Tax=Aestuariivivens sediminicola TaxID=2913560 RepID=UPI001F5AA0C0|nr:hypothetical protein [Aestuariivivens sediminicola]